MKHSAEDLAKAAEVTTWLTETDEARQIKAFPAQPADDRLDAMRYVFGHARLELADAMGFGAIRVGSGCV